MQKIPRESEFYLRTLMLLWGNEKKARHSPGRGNAGPYVRFPTAIPLSGEDQDLDPAVLKPSLLGFIIRDRFGLPEAGGLDLVAIRCAVVQEVFLHRCGSSLGKGLVGFCLGRA